MRYSRLTQKDMTALHEQDSPKEQAKQTHGALRDHLGQRRVEMFWDLSDECKKDQIFKLRIDDYEVLLDSEQVQRYLRFV